jgi:hypothetical protein
MLVKTKIEKETSYEETPEVGPAMHASVRVYPLRSDGEWTASVSLHVMDAKTEEEARSALGRYLAMIAGHIALRDEVS